MAPRCSADALMFVMSLDHKESDTPIKMASNARCTTSSFAFLAKVIHDDTSTVGKLVNSSEAAPTIPTSAGTAKAMGKVISQAD